jgi:hypothetical protein
MGAGRMRHGLRLTLDAARGLRNLPLSTAGVSGDFAP